MFLKRNGYNQSIIDINPLCKLYVKVLHARRYIIISSEDKAHIEIEDNGSMKGRNRYSKLQVF